MQGARAEKIFVFVGPLGWEGAHGDVRTVSFLTLLALQYYGCHCCTSTCQVLTLIAATVAQMSITGIT